MTTPPTLIDGDRQRTREMGIRVAVGATQGNVLKLFIGQGLTLCAVGVIGGLIITSVVTRFSVHLLYGVTATDPLTFTLVALLLMAVTLLACYFPARRATRIDAMIALRLE